MASRTLKVMWFVPPPIALVAPTKGTLEIEGIRTTSSNEQFEQLVAGNCDAVVTAMDNVFAWKRRSPENDFEIIGEIEKTTPLSLMANKGMESIQDLKGATILVDARENGFVVALMAILKLGGVNRSDYQLIEVGGVKERFDALLNNGGDATLLGPPFSAMALNSGMHEITRVQNEFSFFPGQGIVIKKSLPMGKKSDVLKWVACLEKTRKSVGHDDSMAKSILMQSGYDENSAQAAISNFPLSLIPSNAGIEILREHRRILDLPGFGDTYEKLVSHAVLTLE